MAWSEGRRPSGAGLHTSDEPGELSKWPSHDDSTINIVIRIIIIVITNSTSIVVGILSSLSCSHAVVWIWEFCVSR